MRPVASGTGRLLANGRTTHSQMDRNFSTPSRLDNIDADGALAEINVDQTKLREETLPK